MKNKDASKIKLVVFFFRSSTSTLSKLKNCTENVHHLPKLKNRNEKIE
jgi:hypothetical protein